MESKHQQSDCGGCSKEEKQALEEIEESQGIKPKNNIGKPELSANNMKQITALQGGAASNNKIKPYKKKSYEQMLLIKKTFEIQKEQAEKELLDIKDTTKNNISYEVEFQEEILTSSSTLINRSF